MEDKKIEIIKGTVQELIEKIGFDAQVEVRAENGGVDENIVCNITVAGDSNILIGQYGVNLQAIQHIARLLVRKKTDEKVKFMLDINNYRKEKNDSIADIARQAAEQAVQEGRAVVMRPMSAYERRLVHLELAENTKVVTESIGEGEARKVVIKPSKLV